VTARWPAMMRRRTASEYLELSEAAFEREVVAGRLPAAIVLGGRDHWSKDAIDAAINHLTGSGQGVPDYRRKTQERYGQAA